VKYIDEFRHGGLARVLGAAIARTADRGRQYRLMEFCGGHTHAIFRYGVQDLLPVNIQFVHGPGCPVCVLPVSRIDRAIQLVEQYDVTLCTYGDLLRIPASGRRSLLKIRAQGGDVRMIYSTQDSLRIARENPGRHVVFFAIGFETTTPPTAVAIVQARRERLSNFSVFCNHVLTPPAMRHIVESPHGESRMAPIDGFLGPSHVSSIIGSKPYEPLAAEYRKPIVISGFEPLDVMQSTLMLIRQINEGRFDVENEYTRVVTPEGNEKAKQIMARVFELRRQFEWRGLGTLPLSGLRIRSDFAAFDAEQRFSLAPQVAQETKGCDCPEILRGVKRPPDCKLFAKVCTPDNPMGACMVSSEGACAAYFTYGRMRHNSARRTNLGSVV